MERERESRKTNIISMFMLRTELLIKCEIFFQSSKCVIDCWLIRSALLRSLSRLTFDIVLIMLMRCKIQTDCRIVNLRRFKIADIREIVKNTYLI